MVRVDERKAAMRAIQIARLDGPQAAEVVEIDEPSGDGAVLIDVHAAGVAFPDALQSRGLYQYKPQMPYTPGAEIAGVVRSAPDGAHVSAGDRVCGLTMLCGAMAEVVALQAERVFKLPDSVSFEAGAGLLFNDLTMHHALLTRGRLADGETVLVHGAAGGIGTSTLRLAPAWGASRTIAVVIVVDPVGGDRFTDSLRSLAPGGRLLVIGFTGGAIPEVKVNRLLLNNVDAVGVGWGAWSLTHPGYLLEQWAELEPLLASGKVSAPEPEVYPLERAANAIASLEDRTAKGKVVVTVR